MGKAGCPGGRNNSLDPGEERFRSSGSGFFLQCGKKNQKRSAPCLPRVGSLPANLHRNDSAATSDTADRSEEEGQSPSLLPPKPRCWNCGNGCANFAFAHWRADGAARRANRSRETSPFPRSGPCRPQSARTVGRECTGKSSAPEGGTSPIKRT